MAKRALYTFLTLSMACGGAGGKGSASPSDAKDEHESIGDLAAAQGGLAALGGEGNREGATGSEAAMSGPLRFEEVEKGKPVKLDGVLKEWHARSPASEPLGGKTDGLGLSVALQYDATKVYVGGEVTDANLVRSGRHGASDDHVVFTLAFPAGRGKYNAYAIGLFAGTPGEAAGAVKWLSGPNKGKSVAGAKIVEADGKAGYTFEAVIPWVAFRDARAMRVGLRGTLRYQDHGGGVIGTAHGDAQKPDELPPLPTAAEQAVVDGLLEQKGLAGTAPKIDVFADLTGDELMERVSVFGNFFTICGPGYRGGHQFFWREIAGEIATLEARELTGRGKDDLVVGRRFQAPSSVRETLEVWSLLPGDEPVTVFSHEIGVFADGGKKRVANAVRMSKKEIEVSVEPATGWDAATYREGAPSDYDPVLLPWGTVKSRTFRFENGTFTKASEVAQAGSPAAPAAGGTSPAPMPRDVPTPPVKRGGTAGGSLLEAYYRDQGVPAGTKPRADLEVNVDGDARPERVALIGRDVVVLGPGFKGGNAYARLSLTQFATDKDVGELTVRDVTGDGHAEILIRGVRRVTSPSGDRVDIEGLFIYHVTNGNFARIFAVETGREQGKMRVQGLVQFVPAKGGKGFDVDVRPGLAKGWTEKTYPWPEEQPGGSIEPLLLPWGKTKSRRYAWNGTQFSPEP
jgi:hypothetical protein